MTEADAVLALESPVLTLAIVVNVYAVPAVSPVMVHDPEAPVTVHFAPPGVAVTSYEVGVRPPVGAVTVIVALSSPATTVGTPGVFGFVFARTVVDADAGHRSDALVLQFVETLDEARKVDLRATGSEGAGDCKEDDFALAERFERADGLGHPVVAEDVDLDIGNFATW